MRTHVDLFSGIGGFTLAAQWVGVETVAFAEIDPYASRVLQKHWPHIRNYGNVRAVPAIKSVWLLTGGVPCQPASHAGKQLGTADDRWLWPQALAVVERGSYEWLLFENPDALITLNNGVEFERICLALEGQGYEVQPIVIPACAVGAYHRRNRVWIIAHSDRIRQQRRKQGLRQTSKGGHGAPGGNDSFLRISGNGNGLPAPRICRGANEVPNLVDRLRCLGNTIVPQIAYQLIKRMIESEEHHEQSFTTV